MKRYTRKYGGSTFQHRLVRRTRNTFRPVAKFLVPLVNKFGPELIDVALSKIAGKGRRYTRSRSGHGFFGNLAKKSLKKYAPNAINILASKAKSYVGDNSLASQLIDKGAMMAHNKVAGSGRHKSIRHMLKYSKRRRSLRHKSRRSCGGALYGSALMPAGYGMSRGRRGRGLRSRINRSYKKVKSMFGGSRRKIHRSMRHSMKHNSSRRRHTRGHGMYSGLAFPRG